MAARIHARGKWKQVKIDPNLFIQKDLENLICFEELTDYDFVYGDNLQAETDSSFGEDKEKQKKRRKHQDEIEDKGNLTKKKKSVLDEGDAIALVAPPNKKQKKNHRHETEAQETAANVDKSVTQQINSESELSKKKKKKKRDNKMKKKKSSENANCSSEIQSITEETSNQPDMSAWNGLSVPASVLKCLAELQFTAPTPIQALALPPAINDRLDIVGAAETGSGKTLAFCIPLIHHILQERKERTEQQHEDADVSHTIALKTDESDEEADEPVLSDEEADEPMSDEEADKPELSDDADNAPLPGVLAKYRKSVLHSLIVTPTRELAIQIRDHILAITKYTDIKCCVVVGGMSVQKQTRLLRRCPEIVIGTPGRLWELIQQGNDHLSKIEDIRYLIIDEADRMVEKGHFQELTSILQLINNPSRTSSSNHRRQTFVFSATLTFVPTKPQRLLLAKQKKKKSAHQITTKEKLESLMLLTGITTKVRVIDLTRKEGTSCGLVEMRLACTVEEKDMYLYYLLRQYPGRTLVFANSKDCVRRLISVFTLLNCRPLAIHADMHQRQRLRNLDKFKGNAQSLLIATDVAARGLDIPDVQHVVHYQVPRTTENYVHRSGRTARAMKEGLSVMLVAPDDLPNYRKIIKALNRDEELPLFPLDNQCIAGIKPIISLARRIDVDEHSLAKTKARNRWFLQAATDLDIELDDDQLDDDPGDSQQRASLQRKLLAQKRHLEQLLNQPVLKTNFSGKYPTKSGKLITPELDNCAAITRSSVAKSQKKRKMKISAESS